MTTKTTSFGVRKIPKSYSSDSARKTRIFALYAIFAFLVASNVALGLALAMGSEISQLWNRAKDPVLVAYEARTLQLRMEVDRLHSQQYLQAGNLNLQLQELLQRQQVLTEQNQFIRVLVQKAEVLGLTTATISKPAIDIDNITTSSIFARSPAPPQPANQVEEIERSLLAITNSADQVLNSIFMDAQSSTDQILQQLSPLGITLDPVSVISPAVGGPFVPAQAPHSPTAIKTNQAFNALLAFAQARTALIEAPIHYPFAKPNRISSPFGTRNDPFGGARAFHTGIDYPAPVGTEVFTTGQGKVVYAGLKGGYGKFIEVEHANGIISRYAHLSKILVNVGQQISPGTKIGEVGSTGRSTGSHLHFEIRRNQTALNPQDFLNVSRRLSQFIS
ncbi:MAG: M23 family metallopeptidase [Devosiaceae bacterium]|nr:M23 family metallopeptidase [Devosiaceae bacterium]